MCACTRISTAVRVSTLIVADAAAPLYEGSTACAGTRAYGRRCSPYARAPAGKNACWPPLASVRPAHDCAGLRALQLVVAWRRSKEARKQHNCSRSATDPGAAAPLALDLSLAALNVARLLFEHLLGIGLLLPQPKELHDAVSSRFGMRSFRPFQPSLVRAAATQAKHKRRVESEGFLSSAHPILRRGALVPGGARHRRGDACESRGSQVCAGRTERKSMPGEV